MLPGPSIGQEHPECGTYTMQANPTLSSSLNSAAMYNNLYDMGMKG